jgi:hypothetical protein
MKTGRLGCPGAGKPNWAHVHGRECEAPSAWRSATTRCNTAQHVRSCRIQFTVPVRTTRVCSQAEDTSGPPGQCWHSTRASLDRAMATYTTWASPALACGHNHTSARSPIKMPHGVNNYPGAKPRKQRACRACLIRGASGLGKRGKLTCEALSPNKFTFTPSTRGTQGAFAVVHRHPTAGRLAGRLMRPPGHGANTDPMKLPVGRYTN